MPDHIESAKNLTLENASISDVVPLTKHFLDQLELWNQHLTSQY